MASRLGLGRIIEWAKNADMEELHYVVHRASNILQARAAKVDQADANGKVRRTRKAKNRDTKDDVRPPTPASQAHEQAAGAMFE